MILRPSHRSVPPVSFCTSSAFYSDDIAHRGPLSVLFIFRPPFCKQQLTKSAQSRRIDISEKKKKKKYIQLFNYPTTGYDHPRRERAALSKGLIEMQRTRAPCTRGDSFSSRPRLSRSQTANGVLLCRQFLMRALSVRTLLRSEYAIGIAGESPDCAGRWRQRRRARRRYRLLWTRSRRSGRRVTSLA